MMTRGDDLHAIYLGAPERGASEDVYNNSELKALSNQSQQQIGK